MRVTEQTNHGHSLRHAPLSERWIKTPVAIRADIAERAKRVPTFSDASGADLLAYAMYNLSLESASFGGIGGSDIDLLIKGRVKSHHRTWIMTPLERLYDELATMESGVAR